MGLSLSIFSSGSDYILSRNRSLHEYISMLIMREYQYENDKSGWSSVAVTVTMFSETEREPLNDYTNCTNSQGKGRGGGRRTSSASVRYSAELSHH